MKNATPMLAALMMVAITVQAADAPPASGPGGPPGAGAAANGGPPGSLPANCPQPAAAGGNQTQYLLSSQGDFVAMLPPPPAADSEAQRQDLLAVLAAQRAARADKAATDRAVADAEANCNRFADVVGAGLNEKSAEKALAFLNKAAREVSGATSSQAKRYWQRPRPFTVSTQVQRLADVAPGREPPKPKTEPGCETPAAPGGAGGPNSPDAANGPNAAKKDSPRAKAEKARAEIENGYSSYPSGHSTYGTACVILLAEIVPEKRAELFARGREYGAERMIVGAHFPTDIESGRLAATAGVALMSLNPAFQHDLYDARAQLRAALQLPAELPDLKPAKPKAVEEAEKAVKEAEKAEKANGQPNVPPSRGLGRDPARDAPDSAR
ncbi:MAG: phosphatase PAP2 family protein [Steroidobacteraceae bacterium]